MNPHETKTSMRVLHRLLFEIKDRVYEKVCDFSMEYGWSKEPVPFVKRHSLTYRKIVAGEKWGDLWDCAWFYIRAQVPQSCAGKKLTARIDLNGEGCLFNEKGEALRGLTNVNCEYGREVGVPGKRTYNLTEKAIGGEVFAFWIDAGCNDMFGNFKGGTVERAEICICRDNVRDLAYDYQVLFELMSVLPDTSPRKFSIMYALEEVNRILFAYTDEEIARSREVLRVELDKKNGTPDLTFYAIGNAHIDLAWLWPIRETHRKVVRTFATLVEKMQKYPDYLFALSQPQMLAWLKEDEPVLYGKVKDLIRQGRIESVGGMWVESDTNVPSGESLIRQIYYGKKFYKEEFGFTVNQLFLPDVFGYSVALPQIAKKSGLDNFLTIKICLNQHNHFPYHSFLWEGLDDSKLLAHMPPEGNYNSPVNASVVLAAQGNYLERGKIDKAVILYGIGDGGGGPGNDHLERMKREQNLSGLPVIRNAKIHEFFVDLNKDREKLSVYKGELYFERHQGTYTSAARNKYYNRVTEKQLHVLDYLSALTCKTVPEYETIVKELLLYQFHDILPGSSIKRVYNESLARYRELHEKLDDQIRSFTGKQEKIALNVTAFPTDTKVMVQGKAYRVQMGPYAAAKLEETAKAGIPDKNILEDAFVRVRFDENGNISSLYSKTEKREALSAPCRTNIYADNNDAWDLDDNFDRCEAHGFTVSDVEVGADAYPYRKQILRFGNSKICQKIILKDGVIEFENDILWKEKHKILLFEATPAFSYTEVVAGTQFGSVKRSALVNNSWDFARAEFCAHHFVDACEGNFGLAVLSRYQYGFRAVHGKLTLCALRSTQFPAEDLDDGEHRVDFAYYVHANGTYDSDVIAKSYLYEYPPVLSDREYALPFRIDGDVILETVKPSEDGTGIILRLYEYRGRSTDVSVRAVTGAYQFYGVSLTEEVQESYSDPLCLHFTPFEIQTIKAVKIK